MGQQENGIYITGIRRDDLKKGNFFFLEKIYLMLKKHLFN